MFRHSSGDFDLEGFPINEDLSVSKAWFLKNFSSHPPTVGAPVTGVSEGVVGIVGPVVGGG